MQSSHHYHRTNDEALPAQQAILRRHLSIWQQLWNRNCNKIESIANAKITLAHIHIYLFTSDILYYIPTRANII